MKKVVASVFRRWTSMSLVLRILIGLVIGAVLGLSLPDAKGISILGTVFVGALKAIAPVLVAVLVASALSKAHSSLGPRFRTVVTLYLLTTALAAVVAVMASILFPVTIKLQGVAENAAPGGLLEVFENMALNIVSNPLHSVSTANYIGILFWAILTGLALKKCASAKTIDMVSDFADVVSQVVRWVIQFAPFGILGLVYSSVAESGLGIFTTYGRLLVQLVGCMLFVSLVINPIVIAFFIRCNPYPLVLRCLKESGLNAFFTRSSAANIPINMQLCKDMGLDREFYSVSIPLGSTINMDGAAITITVMTLAVCHTLGISVSIPTALFLSLISTLAACGASGVAGGSLLLIPMACSLFGITNDIAMQAVAVGFIIGVVQDSVETALNSSGDVMFTAAAEMHDKMKNSD